MWSRGTCVPNFRSVSFFVRPGGVTQILQVKIGISPTGCSPTWVLKNVKSNYSFILHCSLTTKKRVYFFNKSPILLTFVCDLVLIFALGCHPPPPWDLSPPPSSIVTADHLYVLYLRLTVMTSQDKGSHIKQNAGFLSSHKLIIIHTLTPEIYNSY